MVSESGQGAGNVSRAKQILAAVGYKIEGGQRAALRGQDRVAVSG